MCENLRQRYKIRVEKSTTHFLMARRLLPATHDEIFPRFYPAMFAPIRLQNRASGGAFAVAGAGEDDDAEAGGVAAEATFDGSAVAAGFAPRS